jgi:hypothetical protein
MSCDDEITEETTTRTTYCDRDRVNNVWVEGADENGEGGVCLLDTMNEAQVVYVLQRDETARRDLLRVTSDEQLLELANTVPRLPVEEPGDVLQRETNHNSDPNSLPFYNQFRGQPPWNG